MSDLLKTNLLLWTVVAVSTALLGDAVSAWVLNHLIGNGQVITPIMNITGAACSVVHLISKGKQITRYDWAISLPALVTCAN